MQLREEIGCAVRIGRALLMRSQTRSTPSSRTLKASARNFRALIRACKVSAMRHASTGRSCLLLANFHEAGEANESYDLRKIFDNTYVDSSS